MAGGSSGDGGSTARRVGGWGGDRETYMMEMMAQPKGYYIRMSVQSVMLKALNRSSHATGVQIFGCFLVRFSL